MFHVATRDPKSLAALTPDKYEEKKNIIIVIKWDDDKLRWIWNFSE